MKKSPAGAPIIDRGSAEDIVDAKLQGAHMAKSAVTVGDFDFYWVWIDPSDSRFPMQSPILVVAQPWRDDAGNLRWEGCGTDEGVRVLSIVAQVTPPPFTVRPIDMLALETIACYLGEGSPIPGPSIADPMRQASAAVRAAIKAYSAGRDLDQAARDVIGSLVNDEKLLRLVPESLVPRVRVVELLQEVL